MSIIAVILVGLAGWIVAWVAGSFLLRLAGCFLMVVAGVAVLMGVPLGNVTGTAVTGLAAWAGGQVIGRAQTGTWPSTLLEALAQQRSPSHR